MQLYNALTQEVEPFEPRGDVVTIYICGITPYDTTHLGHLFTYAVFDILIRYLEFQGYEVRYAQNVTDIDDDILRKAGEVNDDWQALGNRWTRRFIEDLRALNIRPPDFFPRATAFIEPIVVAVQTLLEQELAYESNGNVYFDIDAWPEFGELSRIPRQEMLAVANERGNVPDDPNKDDPLDFVLWQAQKAGEPAWQSPWGQGRPGWHIECSTMATTLLGKTIDIHGGGADLIFPHHECEIAQAEGATGQAPFARFWMHTAMVRHEGEKISKSLGNLVMVRDLLEDWSPDAIRLYLANHHYRESWNHDGDELAEAAELDRRLSEAAIIVSQPQADGEADERYEEAEPSPNPIDPAQAEADFRGALDNDLDTPGAIKVMSAFADQILEEAYAGRDVREAQTTLRDMAYMLGLQLDAGPEERVVEGWEIYLQEFSNGAQQ